MSHKKEERERREKERGRERERERGRERERERAGNPEQEAQKWGKKLIRRRSGVFALRKKEISVPSVGENAKDENDGWKAKTSLTGHNGFTFSIVHMNIIAMKLNRQKM